MARERWCRDHCDEVIENCGELTERQKKRMLRARDINNKYALLDPLSDKAVLEFARIERMKRIRELVLREIKQRDIQELTAERIREIINQVYPSGQKGKPESGPGSVKPAKPEMAEADTTSRTNLSISDEGQFGTPAAGPEQGKNFNNTPDHDPGPCPGPDYILQRSRTGKPYWRKKPAASEAPVKELGLTCPHCGGWIPKQEWIEREVPAGD